MGKIPTKPEDLFWESGKGDLEQALQFLIDTRNYIAQLTPPEEGYIQLPHSGDPNPVGGNLSRPAVLDASYRHMGGDRISISIPIFTPQETPIIHFERKMTLGERFKKALYPETKINLHDYKLNTGFCAPYLHEALLTVLDHYDLPMDKGSSKVGYCLPEQTYYVETSVDKDHFERGRKIIQAYVHGSAQTPEELKADIDRALDIRSCPHPSSSASTMRPAP